MSIWVFWLAMLLGVPVSGWASEQPWMRRVWRRITHPMHRLPSRHD